MAIPVCLYSWCFYIQFVGGAQARAALSAETRLPSPYTRSVRTPPFVASLKERAKCMKM